MLQTAGVLPLDRLAPRARCAAHLQQHALLHQGLPQGGAGVTEVPQVLLAPRQRHIVQVGDVQHVLGQGRVGADSLQAYAHVVFWQEAANMMSPSYKCCASPRYHHSSAVTAAVVQQWLRCLQ